MRMILLPIFIEFVKPIYIYKLFGLPEGSPITVTWSITLYFPFPTAVFDLLLSTLTHGILPLCLLKCLDSAFFPSLFISDRHFGSDG